MRMGCELFVKLGGVHISQYPRTSRVGKGGLRSDGGRGTYPLCHPRMHAQSDGGVI